MQLYCILYTYCVHYYTIICIGESRFYLNPSSLVSFFLLLVSPLSPLSPLSLPSPPSLPSPLCTGASKPSCTGCLWEAHGACYKNWQMSLCDNYASQGYVWCGLGGGGGGRRIHHYRLHHYYRLHYYRWQMAGGRVESKWQLPLWMRCEGLHSHSVSQLHRRRNHGLNHGLNDRLNDGGYHSLNDGYDNRFDHRGHNNR